MPGTCLIFEGNMWSVADEVSPFTKNEFVNKEQEFLLREI